MSIKRNQAPMHSVAGASPLRPSRGRQGGWALSCIVAVVVLAGAAFPRQQPQASSGPSDSNPVPQDKRAPAVPAPQGSDAASPLTSQQIAEDSAMLLKLATDLKAEVDKTNKDTLSLRVVRKADEIERLAHNVRARMKAVVAAN